MFGLPAPVCCRPALLNRFTRLRALRQVCPAVAWWLRIPEQECRSILRRNRSFLRQVEKRRNQRQTRASLRLYLNSWQLPQQQAYRQLLSRDSRPRIIASYHFGDFVYGMNLLLREEVDHRPCRVLTLQSSSLAYFQNMAQAFGERGARPENQLSVANTPMRELSMFLRNAQGTLVTFCDLPPGFGASTKVDFLGRSAWFPRGAATLALRNRVPLLPVVSYSRGGEQQLLLGSQIEPGEYQQRDPARAVQAITQRLVNLLEDCLQHCPEQWRYLAALPSYFQPPQDQVSAPSGERPGRVNNEPEVLHARA